MSKRLLNRELLPGNDCFGCGHDNPRGLQIEVTDGEEEREGLAGRFVPPTHSTGFPGITHGGALFTAMDCLATWVVALQGPQDDRYWLLESSDVSYRKAAPEGEPLRLAGRLAEREFDDGRERLQVHVEIRDEDGDLVSEGKFREVPVTAEKLRLLSGIEEIPDAWRSLFERGGSGGGRDDPGAPG